MNIMEILAITLAGVGILLACVSLFMNSNDSAGMHHNQASSTEDSRYVEVTTKRSQEREFYDKIDQCFKKQSEIETK